MAITESSAIVIVGAGCFGLSTAYHLLKRGFPRVTILDGAETLPAPHSASNDINRIVRSSYSDPFYACLAREAIEAWKNTEEWEDVYHESGVFVYLSDGGTEMDEAFANDVQLGARVRGLDSPESIKSIFPSGVETGAFTNCSAYLNYDGGWVNATRASELLLGKVQKLGGKVVVGHAVMSLIKADGKTKGVRCVDGTLYDADVVILSVGSWSASTFPELGIDQMCTATAQSNVMIRLSPEEAELYRACPVYLDLITGFCTFPPNEDNVIKSVQHSAGYVHSVIPHTGKTAVSTPYFATYEDGQGTRVPRDILETLRKGLSNVYPALGERSFDSTRMCWYTDSPDEDWIIGSHPSDENVMLATAGSGHAFKFLPVIGRLVTDAIQGKMDPALEAKFAVNRQSNKQRPPRHGLHTRELSLESLSTPEDLIVA
ncbi:FAD dependent oxidoreductase [Wolfiporia cocos MD-104 SS10]|uniref:FAD dependent oxidoreductase n=1 Tax=Wolfiporia cocos (strain MD-104) TaxID=742152 RepID=A0A2H3JR05_WOLCO|nr:FAD dependent oxidoreductase [Wolfiporia cocos MD-104 SS10]